MARKPRNFLRVSIEASLKPLYIEVVTPRHFPRGAFQLLNISRHGFFLTGDCSLEVDTKFKFFLCLTENSPLISGEGVVKSIKPMSNGEAGYHGFGVELLSLEQGSEGLFHRYLEDCMMGLKVIDLATDEKLSVAPYDSLGHAVNVMRKGELGAVVVVGPAGETMGIFTEKDALDVIGHKDFTTDTVASFMSTKVVKVNADEPAENGDPTSED